MLELLGDDFESKLLPPVFREPSYQFVEHGLKVLLLCTISLRVKDSSGTARWERLGLEGGGKRPAEALLPPYKPRLLPPGSTSGWPGADPAACRFPF